MSTARDQGLTMAAKLGRNDLCWCGSSKKYKKCHLERETQSPIAAGQLDAQLHAANHSSVCFHGVLAGESPCQEKPIASHTVPRSMLSRIALSGHVYGYKPSVQNFDKGQGTIKPTRIGLNQASTLPLFCRQHDNAVFSPVEDTPFTGTEEQCALLTYRALCLELFKKKQQIASYENQQAKALIERGKKREEQQDLNAVFDTIVAGAKIAQRDSMESVRRLEMMLHAHNYQDLRAYVVLFDQPPEILCAAATFPECDFNGCELQSLDTEDRLDMVTFSLIPAEAGGAFVFAWEKSNDATAVQLAQSLDQLSDSAIPHAVLRFVFSFCENHYIHPVWWDALDATTKASYEHRLHEAPSIDPKRLMDDEIRSVGWNMVRRFWLPANGS